VVGDTATARSDTTGGRYTDVRLDRHVEALARSPHLEVEPRYGDRRSHLADHRTGDRRAVGGQHQADIEAVLQDPGRGGGGTRTGADDDDIEAPDPRSPEAAQERVGPHAPVDHHDRRTRARHGELGTGGEHRGPDGRSRMAERRDHEDHPDADCRRAPDPRAMATDPPALDGEDRGDRERHREQVHPLDVTHRRGRAQAGHQLDPPDQEARGQVRQRRHRAADDTGDRPRRQAPHHDRACRRCRQQVGRDRGQRHAAEGGDQERRHGQLGRHGDRHAIGQGPRPRQAFGEPGSEHDDPCRRGDRELEPQRAGEQRVDQHERGHRESEQAHRGDRPAQRRRPRGEHRHRGGPQDRRLEARQEREEGEQRQRGRQARPQRQASQQRTADCEDERHVGTRHRQEVAEPRGPEVVPRLGRRGPIVADDEPGEQGLLGRIE
jgi:hypothetical protein